MFALNVFFVMSIVSIEGNLLKNPDSFGPYIMEWKGFHLCTGPRSENDTDILSELIIENEKYVLNLNMTFLDTTNLNEVRITVFNLKTQPKTLLWNYKIKSPCQHFTFGSIIRQQTRSKNCVIQKGTYYNKIHITEVSNTFFGSTFFYGEYLFKIITLSKKGNNIICMHLEATFKKPKNLT